MRILLSSLLLALAGLALPACENQDDFGDWASTVRGTVVDSASDAPLAGVEVFAIQTSDTVTVWTTDSTGTFTITAWGYWEDSFLFQKSGYAATTERLGTKTAHGDVSGVVIRLGS